MRGAHKWRLENRIEELVLFHLSMCSGDQIQFSSLGKKCFTHLASLQGHESFAKCLQIFPLSINQGIAEQNLTHDKDF